MKVDITYVNGIKTMFANESLVSGWLLFIANSAIFQLYHGENKLIFEWHNDDEVRFVLDQHAWSRFRL